MFLWAYNKNVRETETIVAHPSFEWNEQWRAMENTGHEPLLYSKKRTKAVAVIATLLSKVASMPAC